ncbi:MAG: hypothetical protein U9O64_07110 [Campylobacterota bacterium]|nr:hypothetical protein [Campylobacterota bacterium]
MLNMFSKFSATMVLFLFAAVSLQAADISAYYDAPYADEKTVKSKLGKEGFKVLTSYSPAGKENLKVMVITNNALTSMASKNLRGFAAIQRVMVDSTAKTVRVTNPGYWIPAFMQKDYKAGSDSAITASLKKALGTLSPTKDVLKKSDLANYHFMVAMPYYEDMLELREGDALSVKKKKKLFEIKLANGSTLVGVKMSKGSENFIDKIGTENALLLPYTVLIENGKAYALHAKYYLAISYPLLSMGQFMKISSIPDTIERSLKKSVK